LVLPVSRAEIGNALECVDRHASLREARDDRQGLCCAGLVRAGRICSGSLIPGSAAFSSV